MPDPALNEIPKPPPGQMGAIWEGIKLLGTAIGGGAITAAAAKLNGLRRSGRKPKADAAQPPAQRRKDDDAIEKLALGQARIEEKLESLCERVDEIRDAQRAEMAEAWRHINATELSVAEMKGAQGERERQTPIQPLRRPRRGSGDR